MRVKYSFSLLPVKLIKLINVFIFDQVDWLRRLLSVIFLVCMGGVYLTACAEGGVERSDEPFISISPETGGVNTEVAVTGGNFPAGSTVMLRLGPPDVGATPFSYGSAVADAAGLFTLTFLVPERWPDGMAITETALTIVAINEDGSLKATAPFAFQPGVVVEPVLKNGEGIVAPDEFLVANEQAIVAAVMNHLVQTGGSTQVAVAVEKIEGEYARVNILPVTADSEGNLTGYLKSVDSVWEALVIGRNFDSDQLLELGIPLFMLPEELLTPEG